MGQSEVFVGKFGGAVNGAGPSSIAIDEITTLDHEIFDLRRSVQPQATPIGVTHHSMELASLVALRLSLGALGLTSAELAEILRSPRGDICEQLHFDSAEGLP